MNKESANELATALRPFVLAAAVGWSVENEVRDAKPNQRTKQPLIAFAGYAGQYAAQSRVSWADWKRLLEAADRVGLLASADDAALAAQENEL